MAHLDGDVKCDRYATCFDKGGSFFRPNRLAPARTPSVKVYQSLHVGSGMTYKEDL